MTISVNVGQHPPLFVYPYKVWATRNAVLVPVVVFCLPCCQYVEQSAADVRHSEHLNVLFPTYMYRPVSISETAVCIMPTACLFNCVGLVCCIILFSFHFNL